MHRLRAIVALGAVVAAVAVLSPSALDAQGVTTGAISGVVTDESGVGVENAQVQVVNRATGYTTGSLTRAGGRYFVQGLEIGNQYAVTVRLLGYAPQTVENVRVVLGTATAVDVRLVRQATELAGVTVTATPAEFSPTRHGISTVVSDSALRKLPSLERNFTDFVALTPQVSTNVRTGGLSAGGVNNRFNHIQIDGASETDLFGLGATGQPGGQASGKSIAIESVKEYQVLLTPFDVRQGNFAGLLVNAVTKSGTNEFHGTAYGFTRGDAFTRSQPYIRDYENTQFGFAVGGPIVRDRAHFFINPEFQRVNEPASGIALGNVQSVDALLTPSVTRFTSLLQRDNIAAGSAGPVTNENPLTNIFGRVDVQLPWNTSMVLRHNYGRAEDDVFSRGSTSPYDFPLSSNAYFFESSKNSTVLQLRTQFSNTVFNELIAGYNTIRDRRTPVVRSPSVETVVTGATLRAGAERFSHANELDQDMFEITNNVTWTRGAHTVTIGGLANFYDVRNLFRQSSLGHWRFGSLDSLELRLPNQYIVGVPVAGDGAVRFDAAVYAGYLQDQWTASPNFTLSAGLRFDVPVFGDRPPSNPTLLAQLNRDTRNIPSGNIQWSPRVSFNWDLTGDQRNQLRGGIGAFTGHPAYVWLSNAFQNSGLTGVALLTCNAPNAPQFTSANIASPPTQCTNGTTASAGAEINLLAEDMRFPQTGRVSLGYDRDLGRGLVATIEGMYTVGMYSPFYENIALAGPQGFDVNGRTMYGPRPNAPALRVAARSQVFEARNSEWEDRYTQITAGLRRRFEANWEGSIFYTWSRARDVQTLTSSTAFSQLRFGRVWAGNLSETRATRSSFEQPHRIVATGVYSFPTRTSVALIYQGGSGRPFTYIASGDLNADAFTLNDPIYVPTAAEVPAMNFQQYTSGSTTVTPAQQAAAFEEFIQSTECLSENRGRILPRNECSSPWTNLLNVSVSQALPVFRQQNVSVQLDVFNFLNLLNKDWGEQTFLDPQVTLLDYRGLTNPTGSLIEGAATPAEPIFRYTVGQNRYNFSNIDSNYQIQLSLRYSF
ncbi:MAG: carboxypeptidase regulatory-like domain-containing protein [Gemmatimonadota bacterium]|nr:carboxypeptidase regulatory-like domain-containing protein [Gemmatimonadota bacterium]